jgi:hypothetical protein
MMLKLPPASTPQMGCIPYLNSPLPYFRMIGLPVKNEEIAITK